jgi:putative hydrolase of the HAD superfamily
MNTIKAITFDFGGTIANGDFDSENYNRAILDYMFRLGFSGGKAKFIKARKAMLTRLRKARERNREIRLEELYSDLLVDLELQPTQETLAYLEQLYYHFFKIKLITGVRELLDDLKRNYKLAIISNIMSNASRLALKKFNLEKYFDPVVLSRDLGIRKPDPRIFQFTLNKMGVKATEVLHVGNSLEDDVVGAKTLGIKTVWIKNETKKTQDVIPDFVISKITELPSVLL